MQRSSSFSNTERPTPPNSLSRIPTPARNEANNNVSVTPKLRRSASLRLPSTSRGLSSPGMEREVWGVGSGSWGKRQQMRKQQGLERSKSTVTPPVSLRGLGSTSSIDVMNNSRCSYNLDDDDDLCSERSYDSTMSVDRFTSRSRRFVVHCNSDIPSAANGASYLTPTQRTALMNKDLKNRLRQAMEDVASREREISRLTQECVELRMSHVRRMGSSSPVRVRSPTPPGVEKDSLNSSTHSEQQVPNSSDSQERSPPPGITNRNNNYIQTLEDLEESKENDRNISVNTVINKDYSYQNGGQLNIPNSFLQPLSLTDSGTCDDDLSLVSPPSLLSPGPISPPQILSPGPVSLPSLCPALFSPQIVSPSSVVSPPGVCENFPSNLGVDVHDGELYQEVLEALQANNPQSLNSHVINPLSALSLNTQPQNKDESSQTDDSCKEVTLLKDQLAVTHEALIQTKGCQQKRPEALLSADEAILLWRQASLQVQLSRARAAAANCHGDVTLQFLKSAFFHLITDNGQGATAATKSHWKAIQSILGFSPEECKAMDTALTNGTFPGGAW